MITKKLKLGPMEIMLLFTLEEEGKSIFVSKDAHRILKSSPASVKNVLYRLRNKERIVEIERGKYLLVPAKAGYKGKWAEMPFLIARHLVEPYYIGFASALNYWGMTEQVPPVTFVITTKRKKNVEYDPLKFKFVTVTKKRFFGMVEEKIEDSYVNISDREKTIIDCLLHPEHAGGIDEVAKAIWEAKGELDFEKLFDYSKKMGVEVVRRRLMYLLDVLRFKKKIRHDIGVKEPKNFMWLDPSWPKEAVEYSKKYGLIINRTKDSLMRWKGH